MLALCWQGEGLAMPKIITNPTDILARNGGYCVRCGCNKARPNATMCGICIEETGRLGRPDSIVNGIARDLITVRR